MPGTRQEFDWLRLAEIKIDRSTVNGDATLQSYWRRDPSDFRIRTDEELEAAGELVKDNEGTVWHLAHAPPEIQNKRIALLCSIVTARMDAATVTSTDQYGNSIGPDGRAQLTGAVLVHASTAIHRKGRVLHLTANDARFGNWDTDQKQFGPGAKFGRATFSDDAHFGGCEFMGSAWFADARFEAGAYFGSSLFSGHARFDQAKFAKGGNFVGTTFNDEVWFNDAVFQGEAVLAAMEFNDSAYFRQTVFDDVVKFEMSQFKANVDFRLARFAKLAIFDHVSFEVDRCSGRVNFRDATFTGTVKFFRSTFPLRMEHFGNAFSGTRFLDFVDFTGAGTHWVAALNDAVFTKSVSLPRPSEAEANRQFRKVVLAAVDAAVEEDSRLEPETPPAQHRTWRLEQIEGGCRTLKNVFGRDRDEIFEQRYHRFQLVARRNQSATPTTEKVLSFLYGVTANYGSSIGRPIICILALVLTFAAVFWCLKVDLVGFRAGLLSLLGGRVDSPILDSFAFSLSRVFPFGAFEDVSKRWIEDFETKKTVATVWVRVLASVESAVALALVFVFGLAVRRKFQTN